jgi:hypothetical protein
LELPEVGSAADIPAVSDFDLAVCTDAGSQWTMIGKASRQLLALWRGSAAEQLVSLAPILPDLGHQLFELATLGTMASAVRTALPAAVWASRTPLAAAEPGRPCLEAEWEEGGWRFYYQTVPLANRSSRSPYRLLSHDLGGAPLRPDIWAVMREPASTTELLIECKYSLDRGYVASGISQVLAYALEYPSAPTTARVHMVVCPDGVVKTPRAFENSMALGTPYHLRQLINAVNEGSADALLGNWA